MRPLFADGLGPPDLCKNSFADFIGRGGQTSLLDPMTVLPLMARVTRHLGLGNTTISTTFLPPFQIARSLGSPDLLGRGQAAWSVVTSATDYEARNFGMDGVPPGRARRPVRSAAIIVVPDPLNGSRTMSRLLEEFRMARSTSATGFMVGCKSLRLPSPTVCSGWRMSPTRWTAKRSASRLRSSVTGMAKKLTRPTRHHATTR
jgi:hypothetical protein